MAKRNYKSKVPLYMQHNAVTISGDQLRVVVRNRNIFKSDSPNFVRIQSQAAYKVSKDRDGDWWVQNFRYGAPMFAPDYWWKLNKTSGKRIEKLLAFVETL